MKIQFVWWGIHWQGFGFWHYPKDLSGMPRGRPIFYGLRLGICEFRYFIKQ